MGSRSFFLLQMRRLAQTRDNVVSRSTKLRPVGPFRLRTVFARFHLCIEKWGLAPFSYCKCGALHKPLYRSVTCSGHYKEHEVGQFWIKNKRLWLGTLSTTFNPGNAIAICSKKIKHGSQEVTLKHRKLL